MPSEQEEPGEITERCKNAIAGVDGHLGRQNAQQIGNINVINIQNMFFN